MDQQRVVAGFRLSFIDDRYGPGCRLIGTGLLSK